MSAFSGATQLYRYPSFLWPIVRYFIPQTIAVKKHRRETEEMLKPLLTNRLREMKNPKFVKPEDMLQWLIDNSKGRGNDVPFQANEHLVVNIAAIHTTGGQVGLMVIICYCVISNLSNVRSHKPSSTSPDSHNISHLSVKK
jgi:hypothetical protein